MLCCTLDVINNNRSSRGDSLNLLVHKLIYFNENVKFNLDIIILCWCCMSFIISFINFILLKQYFIVHVTFLNKSSYGPFLKNHESMSFFLQSENTT